MIAFTTTVEASGLKEAGADWILNSCADIRLLDHAKGLRLGLHMSR